MTTMKRRVACSTYWRMTSMAKLSKQTMTFWRLVPRRRRRTLTSPACLACNQSTRVPLLFLVWTKSEIWDKCNTTQSCLIEALRINLMMMMKTKRWDKSTQGADSTSKNATVCQSRIKTTAFLKSISRNLAVTIVSRFPLVAQQHQDNLTKGVLSSKKSLQELVLMRVMTAKKIWSS